MDTSYMNKARQRLAARTTRTNGCWLWTGATTGKGYGVMYFDGRTVGTHRVAWILEHGGIPDGRVIAHRCDTPSCVRPDHLFAATQAENLADMRAKRRHASGPKLGAAISAGWTAEKRARKAEQQRVRAADELSRAATEAGVPTDWKRCPACEEWKPRAEYHRNAARDDGLKPHCKPCAIAKDVERQRRKRLAVYEGS